MTKKLIQHLLYPGLLLIALLIAQSLRDNGTIELQYLFIILVSANAIIWILERVYPYNKDWAPDKKTLKLDIFYSLSAALVITPVLKLMLFKIFTSFDFSLINIWPSNLPIFIQMAIGVVFADLFIYWFHRLCHRYDFGWRIHVIHHTPTKMHFWASARTHPINLIIFYTTEIAVLLFLGAGADVIALCTLFISINGQFEHCNIDIRPGFLNKVLQTAQTHRVHHSPNWKYSNSNFGNQTVIWDHVFGTYHLPKEAIKEVGIKMHKIPENYLTQLKIPFNLDRFKL